MAFTGVVVIGAWALHELVEVAGGALLGRRARMISHGDQRGVGWSAAIFFVLFPLLRGGALVLILALGLAFASASVGALLAGCVGQRSVVLGHPGCDSDRCCVRLCSTRATRRQAVGVERSSSQDEAQVWPLVPRLVVVAVSGWSDSSAASPFPWWGERS